MTDDAHRTDDAGSGGAARPAAIEGVAWEFQPGAGASGLVVILSPSATFAMRSRRAMRDTLYVADLNISYYLLRPAALSRMILAFAEQGGYEQVLILGASKAGFAALMIAGLCAKARPERRFHVIAFNPQVRLFPRNRALIYPSYLRLLARAERSRRLRLNLERLGDASRVGALHNVDATVVFAEDNRFDRGEAMAMTGRNVRRLTVPTDVHNSVIFFAYRGRSLADVRRGLTRTYAARGDEDVAAGRPVDIEALAQAVVAARHLPTLEELIDRTLAPRRGLAGLLSWVSRITAKRAARKTAARTADRARPG